MKKRMMQIGAMMCAVALLLSGCGGTKSSKKVDNTVEDTKNLYIMTMDNGYGTDFVTELAKAFEAKNEGVKVHVQVVPNGSEKVVQTIKDTEGNDIDIYFNVTSATVAEQVKNVWNGEQALREMTYLYDSQIPGEDVTLGEKVNQSSKRNMRSEGRMTEDTSDDVYYGIPEMDGMMGLFYNETVIDNALGKGNWSVPNTTDELLALCERLQEKGCYFLMPGGMDGFSKALIPTWWAQYEGYENYLKFYEGIGYDTSKSREVEKSNYIFSQPGRREALEVSHALVNNETGYATSNAVEIGVSVLNEYQSRFFIAKNNYAFYPCGSWLGNEVKSDSGLEYDSVVKMMKTPVISSIIESTDSYSDSDEKRLPNITSDEILSQVISYVDGNGELPAGVTEAEVEIIREARSFVCGSTGGIVCPAYSNAKKLADEFLLFMVSDEGLQIAKENSYGNFLAYNTTYEGLDEFETTVAEVRDNAVYVGDFKYSPLFTLGGLSGLTGPDGMIDTALCEPNGKTGTEIFERIIEIYNGSAWNNIVSKVK